MYIPIKTHKKDAKVPNYSKPFDVGADVFLTEDYTLLPGINKVPLGFSISLPQGIAGFVVPRSGTSVKKGVTAEIVPIDPSYIGEIHAILNNTTSDLVHLKKGTRPAQLILVPVVTATFTTAVLEPRGNNAFNSTGE